MGDTLTIETIVVVLRTDDGLPDVGVEGKVFVGKRSLAVTPALLADRRTSPDEYFVTHIASGLRFGDDVLDKTDALALMGELYATGVDWTKDADAFTPEDRALVRPVLRRYMGQGLEVTHG